MISIDIIIWILTSCDIPLILDVIRKGSRMCLFPEMQSRQLEAMMLQHGQLLALNLSSAGGEGGQFSIYNWPDLGRRAEPWIITPLHIVSYVSKSSLSSLRLGQSSSVTAGPV